MACKSISFAFLHKMQKIMTDVIQKEYQFIARNNFQFISNFSINT